MIRVENVSKKYKGQETIGPVSFEVPGGETFVLLGTSGSGKTTVLRLINGLISPDSGDVYLNNTSTRNISPWLLRRNMGYVLQNNGLFPHYTVEENIATVPVMLGWEKRKIEDRVQTLMEKLRLPAALRHSLPGRLSGGQQQRVGVARALAANPEILLMDEPFGALDPITRSEIRNEFLHLDELRSKTIILVTHDVQEAFMLGDRVCLMDRGKILQVGKPSELVFHAASPAVDRFFEGQRLWLELHAITLSDVAGYLPVAGTSTETVQPEFTLWQVLDRMQKLNLNRVSFTKAGVTRAVTLRDVFSVLQQLKKQLAA